MRINLECPYDEKDRAKRLGAKWDGKTWYIVDVEDLTPFMRWIKRPEHVKPCNPVASNGLPKHKRPKTPKMQKKQKGKQKPASLPPVRTKSAAVKSCGCDHILPWDDCEHTDAAAAAAMREMLQ